MSALIIYSSLKRMLVLPTKSIIIVDEITRNILRKKNPKTGTDKKSFAFFLPFSCNNEQFSYLFLTLATRNKKAYVFLFSFFLLRDQMFYLFHLCSTSRYSPLSLPRPPHSHSNLHYLWTFKSTQSPFFND